MQHDGAVGNDVGFIIRAGISPRQLPAKLPGPYLTNAQAEIRRRGTPPFPQNYFFTLGGIMTRRIVGLSLAFTFLLTLTCLAPRAHAQNVYATIHGTVTDNSGAVIPNAQVTALNTSTGISTKATTDSSGYYTFPQLQIGGPYTVSVAAPGFQSYQKTGITLTVNSNPEANAVLTVGSSTQTVQVEAAPIQVETAETQLKTDIGSAQIESLPLLGRNAAQLEKTAPGVVETSDRFGNFSANGSQTQQSDYLLDGADINDPSLQDQGISVNPDALGEIAVVSNTLNPEYARNSGAIVNETLKTGTNSFHGNGFEYYRDTFLNNGNYFSLPGERPDFHQNLFGGTIGGPVLKNKLFFFLAYQGFRNRTGTTQQTEVFSPAQRGGNFSADPNLATGASNNTGLSSNPMPFDVAGCAAGTPWNACPAFAGGTVNIPQTAWNPLAAALFNKYVPASNTQAGSAYLYNFNTSDSAKADQGVIRVDYHPTQNDTFWASTIFQSEPFLDTLPYGGADLPGFTETDTEHIKIFNADYTRTFNSNTLNDLRVGYYRFNYSAVNPLTVTPPASAGFNISPQAAASGLPNMGLTGYFTLGFSFEGPQPRKDTNLLASDTFTKIVGNHNMKFGVLFEQFGVNNPYYADNNGVFDYSGGGTYSSGDPAIDFVLGIPDSYVQASGSIIDAYSREYYAFAQDSWKAANDLVINYGIGWDAETPWSNKQYNGHGITCWQNSSVTSQKIYPGGPPGLQYAGDPGCTTYGLAYTRWNHFAPRFGFDWSPSSGPSKLIGENGAHQTAIRGGFGVFFNRDSEEEALQNLSSPPYYFQSLGAGDFGGSPAFQDPFSDVAGNGSEPNPFPYRLPAFGQPLNWSNYGGNDFSNVDKNYLPSYAYNFNLNIQRQLPGRMVAQIGYVGSIGRKLPRVTELDPVTPAGHAACLADPSCVANRNNLHLYFPNYTAAPYVVPGTAGASFPNGLPWYLSVGDQLSNGASSYHSFQASLQKQTSHGLYFTLAYTYSHALDNGSGYESSSGSSSPNGAGGSNGRAVNFVPGFEYLNYGDSDYDARHRLALVYNYQIPLLASMRDNRLVNETLGGWHLTGITALQTGFPVTISAGGTHNSLWCDSWTYYGCGDVPTLSSNHVGIHSNPRTSTQHEWFDSIPNADGSAKGPFSAEPIGTFGNTPRNFFHGPGYNYTNLELYKDFPLKKESQYIEIRLESYNVFNHANFGQPDGNYNDSTFGEILNVNQPSNFGGQSTDPQPGRATQLAAKIYF
jgi:hypothetical protein